MQLITNGKVIINGNPMWRIDDMDAGRVGIDMLQHPFALVEKYEDAHKICMLMNESASEPEPQQSKE